MDIKVMIAIMLCLLRISLLKETISILDNSQSANIFGGAGSYDTGHCSGEETYRCISTQQTSMCDEEDN